jgi:hypothetical protein
MFGNMAIRSGHLTKAQLLDCLEAQKRVAASGRPPPLLGQVAVEKKYMTEQQVVSVLAAQKRSNTGVLQRIEESSRGPRWKAILRALARKKRALQIAAGVVVFLGVLGLLGELLGTRADAEAGTAAETTVMACGRCKETFSANKEHWISKELRRGTKEANRKKKKNLDILYVLSGGGRRPTACPNCGSRDVRKRE